MRAWIVLSGLALGCSKSDDDKAWEAYQAEVRKVVKEGIPPFDPKQPPALSLSSWYATPDSFYEAWFGSGLNVDLHRPSWEAQRKLAREMEAAGHIAREGFLEQTPASDGAIDYLIAATSHADANIRARALFILADVPDAGKRPDAREKILPAACGALADANGVVRASAAWAIGRLLADVEAGRKEMASDLTRLLKDPEFFVRHNAACALARLHIAPDDTIAVLREHLRHENWWIVNYAAAGLARIGPRAKAAIPDLLETLKHPYEGCRANAKAALNAIDPGPK